MSIRKKAKTAIAVILALIAAVGVMGACDGTRGREQNTAVVYDLNGGIYKSCVLPFTHYYKVNEGETRLIYEPSKLSNQKITRSGYDFEGWYTGTKNGDEIVFDRAWDFETDTITSEGITLYAKWKKHGNYTYSICYTDETTGEVVCLGQYAVNEGTAFVSDYNNYSAKRTGYTALPGFYDEEGNPWDFEYKMEGSEEGVRDVKIFVRYIKGIYAIVGNATQLNSAIAQGRNIYLTADIDFEGEAFGGFGSNGMFTRTLLGNGHTISNFRFETYSVDKDEDIDNRDSYRMSLFGNANGAVIEDVTFSGVTFVVDAGKSTIQTVIVSPIAVKAEESVFRNVTFEGEYMINKLPSNIDEDSDRFIVVSGSNAYYMALGDENVTEGVNCEFVRYADEPAV